MNLSPNNVSHVMQVAFTAYSINPTDNTTTSPVAAAAEVSVISKQPTHNSRHIVVAVESTFVGTVTLRKFFNSGNSFADEISPIVAGKTVVSTLSPLEEVEILIENTGIVDGTVHVTMMARP